MSEKWDEVEAIPTGKTLSQEADRSALAIKQAHDLKAETSKCSKQIHAIGGEEAVWSMLERGSTVIAVAEHLGVSVSAIDRWVQRGGETRREAYARARARGGQSLAEESILIADQATPQDVQVAKLRIDTRWKMAGKLNPNEYGDKAQEININLGDITLSALRKREIIDVEDVKPVNGADEDA